MKFYNLQLIVVPLIWQMICFKAFAYYDGYIDTPVIGVHLGAHFSRAGIWMNPENGVEIIPNEQGAKATPSYVAFTDEGPLIGQAAMDHASIDPKRTIYGVDRLIGRKINDQQV